MKLNLSIAFLIVLYFISSHATDSFEAPNDFNKYVGIRNETALLGRANHHNSSGAGSSSSVHSNSIDENAQGFLIESSTSNVANANNPKINISAEVLSPPTDEFSQSTYYIDENGNQNLTGESEEEEGSITGIVGNGNGSDNNSSSGTSNEMTASNNLIYNGVDEHVDISKYIYYIILALLIVVCCCIGTAVCEKARHRKAIDRPVPRAIVVGVDPPTSNNNNDVTSERDLEIGSNGHS